MHNRNDQPEVTSVLCDVLTALQDRGLTPSLDEWARASGVSKSHISRVVRGQTEPTFFIALCLIRPLQPTARYEACRLLYGDDAHTRIALVTRCDCGKCQPINPKTKGDADGD